MFVIYWLDYVHALTSDRTGSYSLGTSAEYLKHMTLFTGMCVSESLWIVPGTIGE